MATESEYGVSVQSSSNYGGGGNVPGSNTSTYNQHTNTFGAAPNGYVQLNMTNWAIPTGSTITAFAVRVYGARSGTVSEGYSVQTNGSGLCAGHSLSLPLSTPNWTSYVSCTHTADYPNTVTEANSGDVEVRAYSNSLQSDRYVRLYAIQARITYTEPVTGYSHTVSGVVSADIGKVDGVATADIANVDGQT